LPVFGEFDRRSTRQFASDGGYSVSALHERFARRRTPAATATIPTPKAPQSGAFPDPSGDAEHLLVLLTVPCAVHWSPVHAADPVAEICTVRMPFNAAMHDATSLELASTNLPSQKIAPVAAVHWVVQSFAAVISHCGKLISWHDAWQLVFAVAVQEPLQLSVHLVVQVSVVETGVHVVLQWSSQHAPQDAEQSAEAEADTPPSSPASPVVVVVMVVQEVLHPASQRVVQSVVQSKVGGLVAHWVVQSVLQPAVQVASAITLQLLLHCCSSLAAHAVSQTAGWHMVVQSLGVVVTVHIALAVISIFPQADTRSAWAVREDATSAAKATAVDA
jgi:hypothetical protein